MSPWHWVVACTTHICMALGHRHGPRCLMRPKATTWPSVATGSTGINSSPDNVGPWTQTWLLSAVQAWTTPRPWVVAQATQASMDPAASWPSDTNGCGLDPKLLCFLWWQHGPWMLTQTLATVGPWTKTWMTPWPHVAAQAAQISVALVVALGHLHGHR